MGSSIIRNLDPNTLKDIGSGNDLEASALAYCAPQLDGDYVFLTQNPCSEGNIQKEFIESWQRHEFEVPYRPHRDWVPNTSYRPGEVVKYADMNYLALTNVACTSSFVEDQWTPCSSKPMLVVCRCPRTLRATFVKNLRVGVKNPNKEGRFKKAREKRVEFANSLPPGLSQMQLKGALHFPFIEWFEDEKRDWSYGDNKKLIGGFSGGIPLTARRDQVGIVYGMVYGKPNESESVASVTETIRKLKSIEIEVDKALECCEKPGYRFWPKIFERNYLKKALKQKETAKFNKPTLHSQQLLSINTLMKVAIEQALAGPRNDENPEYWEGKSVSQFAIYIFRTHLFSEWKKINNANSKRGSRADGLPLADNSLPREISISQITKEDQPWDTLKEFGVEDCRVGDWIDEFGNEEDPLGC